MEQGSLSNVERAPVKGAASVSTPAVFVSGVSLATVGVLPVVGLVVVLLITEGPPI